MHLKPFQRFQTMFVHLLGGMGTPKKQEAAIMVLTVGRGAQKHVHILCMAPNSTLLETKECCSAMCCSSYSDLVLTRS